MDRHPFLTVVAAELVTLLVAVAGWNVVQHYRDNGVRLGAGLRSALRF